ncbi:MAG: MoxR family ATPase [Butyrivibrio sp.]|nr:MoxR family ATPase [Butyrivibrio sp.]
MGYDKAIAVVNEVQKAVKGKDEIIKKVIMAFLAGGHVLMEDIPGVGKTTMALAFAKAMALKENRMQFTTDVLPSDVVGFSMFNAKTQEFEFKEGAVMCNLFLADEINRTSSKTQSALLESMEEGQVTVDGVTRPLPKPFLVIATQNPAGSAGTQLLPESQLDRFMIRLTMGYPDVASEVEILKERQGENPLNRVNEIVSSESIIQMQEEVDRIHVDKAIYDYIAMLSAITRKHPMIELGISPRGTLALASMARAHAYVSGRGYVTPGDVQNVFPDVARHRIILSPKARVASADVESVIKTVFQTVPVPRAVS